MPKIHFTSGKALDISEQEFNKISVKLQYKGIRIQVIKSTGDLIPLNSSTIEFIESERDKIVDEEEELVRQYTSEQPQDKPEPEQTEAPPVRTEDAPENAEEKQKKLIDDIMERSNCTHGDGRQKLYKQDTKQGTKYFPVCTFCGKRERYVSVKKIKDGVVSDWNMQNVIDASFYPES